MGMFVLVNGYSRNVPRVRPMPSKVHSPIQSPRCKQRRISLATVKHEPGDPDPYKVGENHTFVKRWTHLVFIPVFTISAPLPCIHRFFLFYDALSGEAEVYETEGTGNLDLKRQHSGWRTYWTQIIEGEFGKANVLFHDAAHGVGAFYALSKSGDIQFIEGWG
jgi:hypothetical protein